MARILPARNARRAGVDHPTIPRRGVSGPLSRSGVRAEWKHDDRAHASRIARAAAAAARPRQPCRPLSNLLAVSRPRTRAAARAGPRRLLGLPRLRRRVAAPFDE